MRIWLVIAFALVLIAVTAILTKSLLALFVALCVAMPVCVVSATGRLLCLLVGGSLVLQSSQELDAVKVSYLALTTVVFVASLRSVWIARQLPIVRELRPVLAGAVIFAVLLISSALVARIHGVPLQTWLRDVAPYGLFAATPIFALDACLNVRRSVLEGSLIVLGTVAAASFSVFWLDRRHLADLAINKFVFPSGPLATALFCYASSAAILAPRRRRSWAALMAFIAAAILITGTRSGILLLAAPGIVALVGPRREFPVRISRSLRLLPVWLLGTGLFVLLIGLATGSNISESMRRLSSVVNAVPLSVVSSPTPVASAATPTAALDPTTSSPTTSSPTTSSPTTSSPTTSSPSASPGGGTILISPSPTHEPGVIPIETVPPAIAAQSTNERVAQARVAFDTFRSNLIFGVGPGYMFEWTDEFDLKHSSFNLDTPVAYPAKFGLVGMLGLGAYLLSIGLFLLRREPSVAWRVGAVSLFALAAVWTVTLPLTLPFEDKGFSFGFLLLLALSTSEAFAPSSAMSKTIGS
jgi:hypothetical protein